MPLNYVRFPDYAFECIVLREVGGGYICIHRLLLEHFAALEEDPKGFRRYRISSRDVAKTLGVLDLQPPPH